MSRRQLHGHSAAVSGNTGLTVVLLLLCCAAPAQAVIFPPRAADLAASNGPLHITSGDVNNDGNADLVTAGRSLIAVRLGLGDGTFGPERFFASGDTRNVVAVADLDHDGNADLTTGAAIRFGFGNGDFGPPQPLPITSQPDLIQFVAVADLNADGRLDLAVVNGDNPQGDISVLPGNDDGTFGAESRFPVGNLPRTAAVADLDGDGNLDLVVPNRNPPVPPRDDLLRETSVLLGRGDGSFEPQLRIVSANIRGNGVVVSDFDEDGLLDMIVGTEGDIAVSVHRGKGDGTFHPAERLEVGPCPIRLAAGDFDLDRDVDVATANWCGNLGTVTLLLNDTGVFSLDGPYETALLPVAVVADDFDTDGALDLATANWLAGRLSVLLNQSPPSGCLDADQDGFGSPGNPACPGGSRPDCDDSRAAVYPGAPEICDRLDNDCDLRIDEGFDADGDRFTTCGGDCADADPAVNPAQPEICDGIDNDCNGTVDLIVQASCDMAPATHNLGSSGRTFEFDVALSNVCDGAALDPSLLETVYVSRVASPSLGDVDLPTPRTRAGCDDRTDDGIWETLRARRLTTSGSVVAGFVEPSDGSCETPDGNRQDLIAILLDVPDGENAQVCVAGGYPGGALPVECCGSVRVTNRGNR